MLHYYILVPGVGMDMPPGHIKKCQVPQRMSSVAMLSADEYNRSFLSSFSREQQQLVIIIIVYTYDWTDLSILQFFMALNLELYTIAAVGPTLR